MLSESVKPLTTDLYRAFSTTAVLFLEVADINLRRSNIRWRRMFGIFL